MPPGKEKSRRSRGHGMPSPALCCACGLCVMLAGINITLVGVFAFGSFAPGSNPPIIIGPVLLALALLFFGACCVCSRRPGGFSAPGAARRKKAASKAGGGARGGGGFPRAGAASASAASGVAGAFELETSEHTIQDTTAFQLSPTASPVSSKPPSPVHAGDGDAASMGGVGQQQQQVVGACGVFTVPSRASPVGGSAAGVHYRSTAESVHIPLGEQMWPDLECGQQQQQQNQNVSLIQ
ncbi:transmembrane protein 275 [Lampetra fluviatilis]